MGFTEACVGCGICTRVCPRGSIRLADGKASQSMERCLACLACIHACPQKAIQFTFPEKNPNARYRNPYVTLGEIIAANEQKR
ncbi:MAG: 4Fe-4S binding protein [Selenomonadaceae bacterium]|nr:4Fe-4S binding protein [Selenomonadaceae bacterium]